MPYLESKAEVRVSKHVLISDSGALITRRIYVERVPVLNRRNFKELEKCCSDCYCEEEHHVVELYLRSIHVTVYVKEEHHVHDGHELCIELYRGACSDEDKDEKLEEVRVCKVNVIYVSCEGLWEQHLGPKEVAGGLHEVEDE